MLSAFLIFPPLPVAGSAFVDPSISPQGDLKWGGVAGHAAWGRGLWLGKGSNLQSLPGHSQGSPDCILLAPSSLAGCLRNFACGHPNLNGKRKEFFSLFSFLTKKL